MSRHLPRLGATTRTATTTAFAPHPLARAARAAMLCTTAALLAPVAVAQTVPVPQSTAPAERSFSIAAGPLAQVVAQYANAAGVALAFDATHTGQLRSPGLQGRYSVDAGFARVLEGSGLRAVREPGGSYVLRSSPTATPATAPTAPTAAGTGAAATTLSTVTVVDEGMGVNTEHTGSYTTGGTSIGKRNETLRETPQSVSVITRQRLEDQNLRSLDDAMSSVTGITVEQSHSFERTYYSRGFEIDAVQYDGVPTTRRSGFLISPDLFAYDRVEVLRGPAGLFNGAVGAGGAVNLVRKRPVETRQFLGQVGAGSWNNYRADADLNVPINADGSVRARVVAAYEDREFFYDFSNNKRSMLYAIGEADIGRATTVGLGLQYEHNDMVPYYAGAGRYSDGRDLGLPRSTYLNGGWQKTDVKTTTVFGDITHRFANDWKLKVGLTHMKEDNDDFSGSNFYSVNPATGTGVTLSSFKSKLVGTQDAVDAVLTGSFDALGRKHDVIVGYNYQQRDYDNAGQLYDVIPAGIDPFTYNPRDRLTAPTVPAARAPSSTTNRLEQSGLYSSLRWTLSDPLKLIVGGRLSWTEISTYNRLANRYNTAPYKESSEFLPYAALSYELNDTWSTYVSHAEIFRSQANSFTVEGNPLKPATGTNQELGLKGAFYEGKLNAAFALFRVIESGRSQADPNNPAPCIGSPTGGACSIAEGKVRSQGLDAEISGELLAGLQVAAGYTYNQTRYLRDRAANGAPSANEGQPLLSFAPRHIGRVWATYRLPGGLSGWTVGGGVNVQSEAYKTSGTIRINQGGYSVWSARVGYRINRNLNVALNVNNVFDKTYYRTIGTINSNNWYGDPRNVMLTLQVVF